MYQLRSSNPVYHRTSKDFFEGFKGELTFGFNREGSHTEFDITRREEVITQDRIHSSNTYSFAGFWCESGPITAGRSPGGNYIVGEPGKFQYGSHTGSTGDGGKGFLCQYREGASQRIMLDWSDYQAY